MNKLKPDYDKYAGIELSEQRTLIQLLTQVKGPELGIVAITAISFMSKPVGVSFIVAIIGISALGVATLFRSARDAPTSQKEQKSQDEP